MAVVAAAYLVPVLQGRIFYSDDTTDINYVMFRSHVTDLKTRGFTAWSPGLATGHYRAADPTYGIWSPLRLIIFLLVPVFYTHPATTVIYTFLAGLGAYLLGLVGDRHR